MKKYEILSTILKNGPPTFNFYLFLNLVIVSSFLILLAKNSNFNHSYYLFECKIINLKNMWTADKTKTRNF